jgi:hypothetical protein
MPAIIYQKTPGGLFATGERTVSTFPSGLVRVEQTFICPTSHAATHRAALAVGNNMPGGSAPAIDGLKIFPEPQEKERTDSFTEFVVSAYGRTNTAGDQLISSRVSIFIHNRTVGTTKLTQPLVENSKTLSLRYVVKNNEQLYKDPSSGITPLVVYSYLADGPNTENPPTQTSVWAFDGSQTTLFGNFIEVELSYYSISSLRWQQMTSNE